MVRSLPLARRRHSAIERPTARHDPDRRHEDRDPDDTRRDALVPALAVAATPEAFEGIGRGVEPE